MSVRGSTAESRPRPGTHLAHYRLEHEMGEGAMGVVYRAHDLALDRAVAIKVLRPETADHPTSVERFAREARAAARVNHENLAHIYFVGAEDGVRFFAMELVPGEDLEELVRQEGPLDLDDAVDLLLQTARGMAAAHRAGVVHRDLKPSNLIRRPDGRVKITDFGLSKSLNRGSDPGTTHAGQILGTPTFMSPEQCRGLDVDHRTDIYALGLTAYFLLTGVPPFPGPSVGQVISDQINTPLPPVSSLCPGVPRAVDEVLAELCAKDRNDRPADMDAVVARLESIRPRDIEPAAIAARGSALLIDSVLAFVGMSALMAPYYALADDRDIHLPIVVFGAVWMLTILVPELLWRRTAGKWMLDLKITREDGMRPGYRKLLLRYLYRYPASVLRFVGVWMPVWLASAGNLGQVALVLAGVLAYFLTGGQTLSDILTHTRVVYSRPEAERRVARFKARREQRKSSRDERRRKRESVDPTSETKLRIETGGDSDAGSAP